MKKIVLITGATGGIGKETALALAKLGHTVIIHGRDRDKAVAVANEIMLLSANHDIDIIIGDLFSMKEVRMIAEQFKKKYNRLDVLINNAGGIMDKNRSVTMDMVESTLGINLFAPFILIHALLDRLQQSGDGRIINYSSDAHKLSAKPDFNDLELDRGYTPLRPYGNSKLFIIWVTRRFSKQLRAIPNNTVTVNSLHPGAVATDFGVGTDMGRLMNIVAKLFRPFQKTAKQGAQTAIYLAIVPEIKDHSGQYYIDKKPARVSEKYYSEERETFLWEYCVRKTKRWIGG